MASNLTVEAARRKYTTGLVIVGILLISIGALTIYDASAASLYNSTFNILPARFFKITDNLKDSTTINGKAQETSGRPVTFAIMNSAQFVAFQLGQGNTSLYSVQNTPTASISFTFPSPDAYYLIFFHGSGYLNTTETVSFQRTYFNLSRFELFSGIILVGLGIVQTYWGMRPKGPRQKSPPQ